MRNYFAVMALIALFATACKNNETKNEESEQISVEETEDKLLGSIHKEDLIKPVFAEWFNPAYQDYTVDTVLVDSYREQLREYDIEVFMGTWCEDSQREVPTLFKVLEAADYPMDQFNIVAIDDEIENYKMSPDGEEKGKNIHHVPTIILSKDGNEVNRIIEYPVKTLEEDLQLIMNESYTPYYYTADIIHERLNTLGAEDFERQLESLAEEFKGWPRDVYELNTYAKTIFRQGRQEEGILVATLNTKIYPDNANAFAGLGTRLSTMERFEEAEKAFEKAVELAPDDIEFQELLEEVREKL